MNTPKFVFLLFLLSFSCCNSFTDETELLNNLGTFPKGALLTTDFKSFEEFKSVVSIEYSSSGKAWVKLNHTSNSGAVISVLESGVSEADFLKAKSGGFLDKVRLGLQSPYFVLNRNDLMRVYFLSRRRHKDFGWPDQAFFDIAEMMMKNIYKADLASATEDELSEKGYINTFNHVVAQGLMTTLFSEKLADFVADTHERKNMPELVTGEFSEDQLKDIKNGVVDNYVDIINNEWGQEVGKRLKQKYKINKETFWTSQLLADYLNEFQSYFSRVFKLRFNPITEKDEITIRFANKINRVMDDVSGMW